MYIFNLTRSLWYYIIHNIYIYYICLLREDMYIKNFSIKRKEYLLTFFKTISYIESLRIDFLRFLFAEHHKNIMQCIQDCQDDSFKCL